MAVREYIGARYVPIFDGDYDAGKVYEPLTIVTYNNSSYTSKTTVPAGTLPTNTTYWALTGNLNGAIVDLTDRVENVEERYPRRKYFRPEDYGAVVDDENVDCAGAIADALNAANDEGGIVLLSDGVYHCYNAIVITQRYMCVDIIGVGKGIHTQGKGSIILGHGNWYTLSFTGGMWKVNFTELSISNDNVAGGCLYLGEDTNYDARSYVISFEKCVFNFIYRGTWIFNPAYVMFNNCEWRGHTETHVKHMRGIIIGGNVITDRNTAEYVTISNSRVMLHNYTTDLNDPQDAVALYINRGSHFTLYHTDLTACDNALFVETDYNVSFIDMYSCDMSDVVEAIKINIKDKSFQASSFRSLYVTGVHTHESDNRILKITKTSGGAAASCYIYMPDVWCRGGMTGVMFEAENGCLFPGQFEIKLANSYAGDISRYSLGNVYSSRDFGTSGTAATDYETSTADLDDVKISGFQKRLYKAACTHSPGFDALILVCASHGTLTQIAIPIASSNTLAFRIFNSNIWGAWQMMAKQT